MPGLPITLGRPAWMVAALGLAFMALASTGASAAPGTKIADPNHPSIEVLMFNLGNDKGVVKAHYAFRSAVQAAMLYSQCPEEYKVDEAKTARYNQVLRDAATDLRNAYGAAHQALMFKQPSDYTWTVIDKSIETAQHDEAVEVGQRIQAKGCVQGPLVAVDRFYENQYAREQKAKADADAAEEKRRLIDPVEINETQH